MDAMSQTDGVQKAEDRDPIHRIQYYEENLQGSGEEFNVQNASMSSMEEHRMPISSQLDQHTMPTRSRKDMGVGGGFVNGRRSDFEYEARTLDLTGDETKQRRGISEVAPQSIADQGVSTIRVSAEGSQDILFMHDVDSIHEIDQLNGRYEQVTNNFLNDFQQKIGQAEQRHHLMSLKYFTNAEEFKHMGTTFGSQSPLLEPMTSQSDSNLKDHFMCQNVQNQEKTPMNAALNHKQNNYREKVQQQRSQKQDAMNFASNRQAIFQSSTLSNDGLQMSGGSEIRVAHGETLSSVAEFPLRIGTTPVFQSLKTSTVLNVNPNLEEEKYHKVLDNAAQTNKSSTQHQAELSEFAMRFKNNQEYKNSTQLVTSQPAQQRIGGHFYQVDEQIGLFSSQAKQQNTASSLDTQQNTVAAKVPIPTFIPVSQSGFDSYGDLRLKDQFSLMPHTENSIQPSQLTGEKHQEDTFGLAEEPSAIRHTSIHSNIVWQASIEQPIDLDVQMQDELNIVSEEGSQAGLTTDPPHIELPSRNSSINDQQNNSGKTQTRYSTKKSASATKKKKKKGAKTATTSFSLTPRIPLPSIADKRMSRSGMISPKHMIVESVKALAAINKISSRSNSLQSIPKLSLKSNTALAAELPKSITPKAKKTTLAVSKKKKQSLLMKQSVRPQFEPVPAKEDESKQEKVHTPKSVLSLPKVEQFIPHTPPPLAKQAKALEINDGTQLMLVSCTKPTKKRTKVPELKSHSEEVLKIEINNGKDKTFQGPLILTDNEINSRTPPYQTPIHRCSLFGDLEISPGARSFIGASNEQLCAPNQMQLPRRRRNDRLIKSKASFNNSLSKSTSRVSSYSPTKSASKSASKSATRSATRSATKSVRELQVLEIPPEYDLDSGRVVEYMFGDKAIEIETPLFQFNIQSKLVYMLTQLNGEEPPAFIKVVENKLGRKVIRIRQKETTGVQQLYQLKLDVRNPETNVMANYKCRVFVRPGTKLQLRKPLFQSPVEYSIKGPAKILQMPVYSAKHDDLDFYLELCETADYDNAGGAQGAHIELPSFVRVSRDHDGNRVIKCLGSLTEEIGTYTLKLIARDKVTAVLNDEFQFTVIGTQGIEVAYLPKEYAEEIKVDPTQPLIQLSMPTFNLETVKEEGALPLEYSLVMRDGSPVPDCIFIKTNPSGDFIIELKAADLPAGCPGDSTVFEVQLKVYDPNADATQLVPIAVKCPEPNLMLVLKETNFPLDVNYSVGSKELIFPVPQYHRNDELPILEPVLVTLGGKDSHVINRIASVITNDSGEQFIKVQTTDQKSQGVYIVKVYATEQSSGLTNQDAIFKLNLSESVLTLTETPNVCFLGKPLIYAPKGPPQFVPLPQYGVQRAQIKFSLMSEDPNTLTVPPFVRIQDDYLVVEGSQNPSAKDYHLVLKAHDPVSESSDKLALHITSEIYEIILERVPFTSPVIFNLGDEIMLPMPIYKQIPYEQQITYELETQGVGIMLGDVQLASIVQSSDAQPQSFIRIGGGANHNKGSYQVTVCAHEKSIGVTNKEVVFMLEAKPQLKLVERPAEFDAPEPMQVDRVYRLPVPTYAAKNRLRYQVHEKGTDYDQSCPSFITVKCPKQAQPYIEIRCSADDLPTQARYELEFIACDNKEHNVENVQDFAILFDLQPRIALQSFDLEFPIKYTVGQGELTIPLPIYDCYIIELDQKIQIKLVSYFSEREVAFASVDRQRNLIVVETENDGFEGLHDFNVILEMPEFDRPQKANQAIKAVRNADAKFRVEVVSKAESAAETADQPKELITELPEVNNIPLNERSSETLPLHDNRSEELQGIETGMYNQTQGGQQQPDQIGDGDQISFIVEDEEGEIPIYYSDDQSNEIKPLTPSDKSKSRRTGARANRGKGSDSQAIAGAVGIGHQRSESFEPQAIKEFEINVQEFDHANENNELDIVQGNPDPIGNKKYNTHRAQERESEHFENILVDDGLSNAPKDPPRMEQFFRENLRENEELRRQIAEVKTQMNQSFAILHQKQNLGASAAPSQEDLSQQQFQQQTQNLQVQAQMQQLAQLQQQAAASDVISPEEIALQEEMIQNDAIKQRIEQSKLRQLQQMAEVDKMRNEQNSAQAQQNQQILAKYLSEITNGQDGRDKDVRLKQLRTQLAQLQEQRASLRHQCGSLKQKEDDLQSDIFTCDQQLKTFGQSNNAAESSRVSSLIGEIELVVHKNEGLRGEVQALEEQLNEKKSDVAKAKAALRETNQSQSELENALTSQQNHLSKLRFEAEQVRRRMQKEEVAQSVAVQRQEAYSQLQQSIMQGQIVAQQTQQVQQFKPQGLPQQDIPQFVHSTQRQQQNEQSGPHSARNMNEQQQHQQQQQQQQNQQNQHQSQFMLRSSAQQHRPSFNPFQPQDNGDQPAAGMRSSRKPDSSQQQMQSQLPMTPRGFMHPQTAQQPPTKQQFYSPNSTKVINPPPQRPIRPSNNNIFDSPNSEEQESTRFQTTYTQFANREKFYGFREGEMGGLRTHNVPSDGVCLLERMRRQQESQLYQKGSGVVRNPVMTGDEQRRIVKKASGVTTEQRRRKQNSAAGIMASNTGRNINYEKQYRH